MRRPCIYNKILSSINMLKNWQIHLCVFLKCKTIFKYFFSCLTLPSLLMMLISPCGSWMAPHRALMSTGQQKRSAANGRYASLYRRAAKESMAHFSICPPSVRARSLAEHINPPGFGAFWNHLFTVGARRFAGSEVSAWPFISPQPWGFSPCQCALSILARHTQRLKRTLLASGTFLNFLVTGLLTMLFWLA